MGEAEGGRAIRRLAAIMAMDVVGYSQLMGRDEEGTLARLKAVRRDLIDRKIREHHGRVFKTTGDGALADFDSVVDAVRCAVEIQRALAAREEEPEGARLRFRIGINLGDVIMDGDDVFGDGVNIAARLETLAPPGGICVSQVVRDQVENKLNFSFADLGDQEVKNIAQLVRVFEVRLDGGTMTVPARPRPIRLGRRGMNAALLAAAAAALTVVVAAMLLWPRSDPQEIALWESVRDSENPLELRAYLDHYPKGAFAEPARSRFERVAPAWIARAVSEGREAEARRDFKTAHARYRAAADLGEPAALHSVCYFTWQGRGTQFDPVAALETCRRAAALQDSSWSSYRLGMLHLLGIGARRDFDEAERLCQTAGQRRVGPPWRFCLAAVSAAKGERAADPGRADELPIAPAGPRSFREDEVAEARRAEASNDGPRALALFSQLQAKGFEAAPNLCSLNLGVSGAPMNLGSAAKWCEAAAALNYPWGNFWFGMMHLTGVGAPRNVDRAAELCGRPDGRNHSPPLELCRAADAAARRAG